MVGGGPAVVYASLAFEALDEMAPNEQGAG
jgi:hypothetical protein